MKALFGLWQDIKVSQINRLLKPFNVRLVMKKSRDWGAQVSVTAHYIKEPNVVTVPTDSEAARNPADSTLLT